MIAILAPYLRNEVTYAAIRLSELLLSIGIEVRYVCCGERSDRVHPNWDHRVRSVNSQGIPRSVHLASHVIHFHHNDYWYQQILSDKTKHIVVASTGCDISTVLYRNNNNIIVCPNKAWYGYLKQTDLESSTPEGNNRIVSILWDTGIPPVPRITPISDDKINVCFVCDSFVIKNYSTLCFMLIREIASITDEKVCITVLTTKELRKEDKRMLNAIIGETGRIQTRKVRSKLDYIVEFHKHDWSVFFSTRSDFGYAPALSLACGTPIVASDIEPYKTIVGRTNGYLVPCNVSNDTKSPGEALPSLYTWVEMCANIFNDRSKLVTTLSNDWGLCGAQLYFKAQWLKVLDLNSTI